MEPKIVIQPLKLDRATLVSPGIFGGRVEHVKDVEITIRPWAQYPRALAVSYREKRGRKTLTRMISDLASLKVLPGWHDVPMISALETQSDGTQITRHSSFSPEIAKETWAALGLYQSTHPGVEVICFVSNPE